MDTRRVAQISSIHYDKLVAIKKGMGVSIAWMVNKALEEYLKKIADKDKQNN